MRRRFYVLLAGLSPEAMWRRMAGDEISVVDDTDQIKAALASLA
ncbi:hypothetical protein [Streptomyces subrutilus]|nr:hypothetical protein OG479_33020 [Streptomyces subrutilus]